ncbi:MAG: GNAT family protein [Candidatus Pacebacteria bacterium]|nr:GNAT family protein [Candidatus Paceibacterota bacterium]
MKDTMFLKGRSIFLRPVESADIPKIASWLNNPKITHFMFYGQLPMNLEQTGEFVMGQVRSPHNTVFVVCDLKSRKPIGYAGLYDIHLTAHKAEFRVLIGEQRFWGKGCGTEVTKLLTFYGFDRLNLNKVYLGVVADNQRAVKSYEKSGYVREGALREEVYRNSRYYDVVKMSILKKEYYKKIYREHLEIFGKEN